MSSKTVSFCSATACLYLANIKSSGLQTATNSFPPHLVVCLDTGGDTLLFVTYAAMQLSLGLD